MESVAEEGLSVLLSSHNIGDMERVCDHLVILSASRVHLEGESLVTTYHPVDRYWPFQAIESGIYLALSLLMLGLTAYRVRRRVT
jgi:ABC-type cobalamin/Fe3+-siderophores transport system ATPase subunit